MNGRYIVNTTIAAAISNAYSSYLMKRQYPFYILHITVPTEIVDVNVHPNKADVRFADNQIIYGCIYSVISAVLDGQTKALEYIVQDERRAIQSPTENVAMEITSFSEKKEETLPFPDVEEVKTEEKNPIGFSTLTYEEAQCELEACNPAFAAQKKRRGKKRAVKGIFPCRPNSALYGEDCARE